MLSGSQQLKLHRWECRVHCQRPSSWRDALLEQVVRCIEESPAIRFDNGKELWLVRQVNLKFCGVNADGIGPRFSRELGKAVSQAIAEALERGQHGPNVKRYESRAHYLADFAVALVDESPGDTWYFELLKTQIIHTVDNHSEVASDQWLDRLIRHSASQWPAVSRVLAGQGRLIAVLRRISLRTAEHLWSELRGATHQGAVTERLRPILAVAIEIWRCLSGEHGSASDHQQAMRKYAELPQPDTDWQDPTHLAEAVCHAVVFLKNRSSRTLSAEDVNRLSLQSELLARLDWLDQEWLLVRLKNLIEQTIPPKEVDETMQAIHSPALAGSHRERNWTIVWHSLSATLHELASDPALSPPALRLAISDLVSEQMPGHQPDEVFEQFIDRMVDLHLHAIPQRPALRPWNRSATSTSRPERPIQHAIVEPEQPKVFFPHQTEDNNRGNEVRPKTAGAWLLLRSLHDLRLPALCRRLEVPGRSNENQVWFFQQLLEYWSNAKCPIEDPAVESFLKCTLGFEKLPQSLKPEASDARRLIEYQAELRERSCVGGELGGVCSDQASLILAGETNDEYQSHTVQLTARLVIEHWGRQLKGLGKSTPEFLRSKCLQRGGAIHWRSHRADVWLEAKPLDVALQISGLLEPLDYFVGTKMTKIIFYTRPSVSGGSYEQ